MRGVRLLRIFTLTFPDGRAGFGLLLLRVALGSASVVEGGAYLFGREGARQFTSAAGFVEVVGGVSLLLGCLTPLACILVGLSVAALRLTGVPNVLQLDDGLFLLFVISIDAAVVLLGPGAFSFDARLFGRRKVIIPQARAEEAGQYRPR
ncbi:MAG TPA: hypothetical protein VKB12_09540 [Pyrinomonadaceae bacterium]|nr:hypothetical protein [Pyrinomonadaceae bacterium]